MSHDSKTSLNSESPVLPEGLQIEDLRRQFDRVTVENIKRDHDKVREISGRLTRNETLLEGIRIDLGKLERGQREWIGSHEQLASSMAELTQRFAVHAEMEERQWEVVNQSRDHLKELSVALSHHLEASGAMSTRLDWIERLVFGVYGMAGSMIMLVGGWLLSKMG